MLNATESPEMANAATAKNKDKRKVLKTFNVGMCRILNAADWLWVLSPWLSCELNMHDVSAQLALPYATPRASSLATSI